MGAKHPLLSRKLWLVAGAALGVVAMGLAHALPPGECAERIVRLVVAYVASEGAVDVAGVFRPSAAAGEGE